MSRLRRIISRISRIPNAACVEEAILVALVVLLLIEMR